jgi:diguanylate cyclase (GGDEF)-like protein
VDRYARPSELTRRPDAPRADGGTVAAALAAIALAPAGVALLRVFPPLVPADEGAGWLLPAAGVASAVVVAGAMVACLERGLRRAEASGLARGVALGLLAVGLVVAALRALDPAAALAFPDLGLAPAAVAAGALLLAVQLVGEAQAPRAARPRSTWLAAFVLLEGAVAASVLLPAAGDAWPWVVGLAAALVAASAVPGPMLAAGLAAAGLAALAAARPGSLDTVIGLAGVAAGAAAYGWPPRRGVASERPFAGSLAADARPEDRPADPGAATGPPPADEDALRLARELRGTIEELMRARRTIEQQRSEIAQLGSVDELTGTATRRAILERLRIEAAEARRYAHSVAVVLLDIDGFAALNRDHGIGVGDEVLREVALRLRLRLRTADALGRIGGDSFIALLPHTDETGAATFADALRRLLTARPVETSGGEVALRVSIGVAFMRAGMALGDEELLAAADEALASARAAGGNRIAFDRAHGLVRLEGRRPSHEEPARGA